MAGGRRPPDPPIFGGGGKAPPDPPLKRSFVTFDRGGQTGPPRSNDFFLAPQTIHALPTWTVRKRPKIGVTLGKRVSDDPRHFIFRRRKIGENFSMKIFVNKMFRRKIDKLPVFAELWIFGRNRQMRLEKLPPKF